MPFELRFEQMERYLILTLLIVIMEIYQKEMNVKDNASIVNALKKRFTLFLKFLLR